MTAILLHCYLLTQTTSPPMWAAPVASYPFSLLSLFILNPPHSTQQGSCLKYGIQVTSLPVQQNLQTLPITLQRKSSASPKGSVSPGPCLSTWRKKWQPTLVLLPGKFHGWRSLVGYSPWDRSRTRLSNFTSLPLQAPVRAPSTTPVPHVHGLSIPRHMKLWSPPGTVLLGQTPCPPSGLSSMSV